MNSRPSLLRPKLETVPQRLSGPRKNSNRKANFGKEWMAVAEARLILRIVSARLNSLVKTSLPQVGEKIRG
jgi:hypothetical protein